MLHDQRRTDGIQRKGSREIVSVELTPTLLWSLTVIVKKSCRVDHKPQLTLLSGMTRSVLQTSLVHQVDRRYRPSAETNYMREPAVGSECFEQCASDTATRAKDHGNAVLGE